MFGVELRPQAMETSRVPTPWGALGHEVYSLSLYLFFIYLFIFFKFYFIFKLYIIVLVLPNIEMNPPQVYMCSPS